MSRKKRPMVGDIKPDQNRTCTACGKKIYRWLVYDGDKLVSFQPWKHWGTGSEYCDTTRARPDGA